MSAKPRISFGGPEPQGCWVDLDSGTVDVLLMERKGRLALVSCIYKPYSGWVKAERVRLKNPSPKTTGAE